MLDSDLLSDKQSDLKSLRKFNLDIQGRVHLGNSVLSAFHDLDFDKISDIPGRAKKEQMEMPPEFDSYRAHKSQLPKKKHVPEIIIEEESKSDRLFTGFKDQKVYLKQIEELCPGLDDDEVSLGLNEEEEFEICDQN
jgi:hypothetical protein